LNFRIFAIQSLFSKELISCHTLFTFYPSLISQNYVYVLVYLNSIKTLTFKPLCLLNRSSDLVDSSIQTFISTSGSFQDFLLAIRKCLMYFLFIVLWFVFPVAVIQMCHHWIIFKTLKSKILNSLSSKTSEPLINSAYYFLLSIY
jgi:hypothetical protein